MDLSASITESKILKIICMTVDMYYLYEHWVIVHIMHIDFFFAWIADLRNIIQRPHGLLSN